MAIIAPPAGQITALGDSVWKHRQEHAGLTEVRYAHPDGDNANDGLTWGTAKQHILAAYDALPATGGDLNIGDACKVGGEVSQQGIWLVGPNDVNYASPPTGWRQQKNVRFIGQPAGIGLVQFAKPSATFLGGTTTFAYDGTTKPAIWLAGTSASLVFENLNAGYVSVGLRAGVGSDGDRSVNTSMVQCLNLNFASYNVGGFKSSPGNMVDIGYLFWGWFEKCAFLSYAPASRDSDERAAVLIKPDPAAEGSGLLYFRDIISAAGGVKFYNGSTSWHLDVENWLHESDFASGEPSTVNLVDVNGFGFAKLVDVARADFDSGISDPYTIKISKNARANAILVAGGDGTVSGPHTFLHGYNARTDLALQRAVGFSNGTGAVGARLVAQHDAAVRQFGPVATRFPNLAAQDVSTWSGKIGSATVTTGQTAPDGTTNAAKLSAGSLDYRQIYRVSRTLAVGDWVIGGVWVKPSVAGGVGGAPGAIEIGVQAAPSAAEFVQSTVNYFGGEPDGVAGKWDWKVFADKIGTLHFSPGELIFSLKCSGGHDMTYYAPILLHIPAGTMTDDEVMEMVYHLSPWAEGGVAGEQTMLLGQKLVFAPDVNLYRSAADILRTDDTLEFLEHGDPAAGAANTARLYSRDNGSGKTQLVVRFNTGAIQVIATEP